MKLRESMTGFYYIGDDRANITKLVSIYRHGYASCNLEEVMAALSQENPLQPEVICCESSFGLAAVRQWARMLSKKEGLSQIPFIIPADNLTSKENDLFVRHPSVDDLLNLKEWDENCLAAKIRFLQKFKKGHHGPERETLRVRLPKTLQGFLKRSFDVLVRLCWHSFSPSPCLFMHRLCDSDGVPWQNFLHFTKSRKRISHI